MAVTATDFEFQDLRRLIPLNMLSADRFDKLCAATAIEDAPKGSVLFSKGDTKNEFVYVLKGTVSLQADGMELETISGGTESSRFALAHQIPRKVSAVAKDRVRFVRVDASFVNQASESSSRGRANYEVSEVQQDHEDDWITTLLSSPIFQRLSPANLQQLLRNLEEIEVTEGQKIIQQDEPGDYYYVIKKGRCALSRKPTRNSRDIKLADLKTCDTFGEDSLISDQPRNVSITMLTDGSLLRIDKANFIRLVKEPVISYLDYQQAQEVVDQGGAWLDVRTSAEFELGHLPGAVNVPFLALRMELANLERKRQYVLVCENGKLSEAAAFLLIRNSFPDAHVMRGGLTSVGRRLRGSPAPALVPDSIAKTTAPPPAAAPQVAAPAAEPVPELPAADAEGPIDFAPLDSLSMLDLLPAEQEAVPAARQAEAARPPADLQLAAAKAELAELRRQVAGKDEEIATLQRSLQQQTQAAATRDALRAEALEAELKATQVDRSRLQEQLQSQQRDPGDGGERAAAARIQELEAQVSELTGVVQEFLEQQAGGNDDSDSLRAELETVRTQASADVMSLQTKLRAEEQEVSRLRRELDGTYAQVLQLQTGLHGGSGRRKSPWRTQAVSIVIGFALLLCGMLLTLFLLRVADLGHSLGVMDAGSEPVRPLAPPPLPALPQLPAPPPA